LSLGQTTGIPSLGPLWLPASPVTEAVLSARDVAVLQGWKMGPEGAVQSPADLCQHHEEAGSLLTSQRGDKNQRNVA